jgi:pimeloyl-ACP methyl ester carboxylesterase
MRSQYEIPCLAPLIRAYDALPKKKRRITTLREGKPLDISVQIVGDGAHKTVLICVPGVMSDSTVFRFLVGAMATEYDFLLIDPPGCGESEAPNPKYLGPGGYGPAALADRELQAIEACLRDCPKDVRVLILAHSLGGLVTLRAFGDPQLRAPYGHVLGRIEGLVLVAPEDFFMSQVSPVLASRADLSGLAVLVGNGLGVVPEAVAQYLAGSFYASHCMPREEVDHAVQVIRNAGTREVFKAMLRGALAFDRKTRQPNFFEMMAQEKWYANIDLPCEIIWGKCDQTVPVYVGYMLEHQLPNARLSVIPDCKHAPS